MKINYKDLRALENCCRGLQKGLYILQTTISPEVGNVIKASKIIKELVIIINQIDKFVIDNELVIGSNPDGSLIIEGEK